LGCRQLSHLCRHRLVQLLRYDPEHVRVLARPRHYDCDMLQFMHASDCDCACCGACRFGPAALKEFEELAAHHRRVRKIPAIKYYIRRRPESHW
jgi:hypothetical protein